MATTMTTILILTAPTASQIRDFNGVHVAKRHVPSAAETVRIKQFRNISINHEGKGGNSPVRNWSRPRLTQLVYVYFSFTCQFCHGVIRAMRIFMHAALFCHMPV